jgi:hypothetical protein
MSDDVFAKKAKIRHALCRSSAKLAESNDFKDESYLDSILTQFVTLLTHLLPAVSEREITKAVKVLNKAVTFRQAMAAENTIWRCYW